MNPIRALTVPRWGMAMEEGTLVKWLVDEGDGVAAGDEILEMESSKIVNVLESHYAGVLRRKLAGEGETLPVGALLGVVAEAAVPEAEIETFIAGFPGPGAAPDAGRPAPANRQPGMAEDPPPATPSGPAAAAIIPDALKQGGDDSAVAATPHARRDARRLGINLNNVEASGRHGRVLVEDIRRAVSAAGGALPVPAPVRSRRGRRRHAGDDAGIRATPMARRLARATGISLRECRATGRHGRVCAADVALAGTRPDPAPRSARPARAAAGDYDEIPLAGMRETIARRLYEAKRQIPHYRLVREACVDELLALRRDINRSHQGARVSVNDLLIRACAAALAAVPACNIQFDGRTIRRYRDADIAIAVALEDGLITPVLRAANRKDIYAIAREAAGLVERARSGALHTTDYEGGTFTLSNLGMFGVSRFDAIINPPQAMILAVGEIERRVVARGGSPAVASMLTLTLSCDHRVIDGALGARFLRELARCIEKPEPGNENRNSGD